MIAPLLRSSRNVDGGEPSLRRGKGILVEHASAVVLLELERRWHETLTEANACLVAAQNSIPLVQTWGGGEVASADGLRFVVPVRTLHAGPNQKYFGYERGVTYYNLISDQFTGLNAVVVPGTFYIACYIQPIVGNSFCARSYCGGRGAYGIPALPGFEPPCPCFYLTIKLCRPEARPTARSVGAPTPNAR
jgi:hypothetical protein